MSFDLEIPKKAKPVEFTTVKFKFRSDVLGLLNIYGQAYAELRGEEVSSEELLQLILEQKFSNDKGFRAWAKDKNINLELAR